MVLRVDGKSVTLKRLYHGLIVLSSLADIVVCAYVSSTVDKFPLQLLWLTRDRVASRVRQGQVASLKNPTLYSRIGDLFAWGCLVFTLLAGLLVCRRNLCYNKRLRLTEKY